MASNKPISVSIESAIHDALASAALAIAREHGIRIQGARFSWAMDHAYNPVLLEVDVDTRATYPRQGAR